MTRRTTSTRKPAVVEEAQVDRPRDDRAWAGAAMSSIRSDAQHEDASPTHDQIAARAYEFFIRRGREHGFDADDWFRAEEELRGRARVHGGP